MVDDLGRKVTRAVGEPVGGRRGHLAVPGPVLLVNTIQAGTFEIMGSFLVEQGLGRPED